MNLVGTTKGCIDTFQTELRLRGFKFTQAETKEILAAFVDTIQDYAREGIDLHVSGLGTFEIVTRAARMAYSSIFDGEKYIPERKKIKFKPSKPLVSIVNHNEVDFV